MSYGPTDKYEAGTPIPPVLFCPHCEYHVKILGLRAGNRAQFVAKPCSVCTKALESAPTGADRGSK